ncbi:hypothetical protein HDU98_005566 [Podochytrium sp. JEL0797]|nr:hypothetical protein HDU98_005566 [Podochytrium sp. JEL0797]
MKHVVFVSALAALVAYYAARVSFRKRIASLEQAAKSEREGRIRLQIELGNAKKNSPSIDSAAKLPSLDCPIVGTISSPYSTRNGTPRQPSLVPSSLARLTLLPHIPTSTLSHLASFSHAWLLFHFHQNTNTHKSNFKGTIKPPRLNGQSVGVFSTRTPHRPSPIGLSLARILEVNVEKGYIIFQGLDLIDETPIVDIKPYVAFSDAPASLLRDDFDSIKDHYAPSWVTKEVADGNEPLSIRSVSFTPLATESLAAVYASTMRKAKPTHAITLFPSLDAFTQFVKENLMLDFRSTRERADPKFTEYRVTLCDVIVRYRMGDSEESEEEVGGGGAEGALEGGSGGVCIVTGCEMLRSELAQPKNNTATTPTRTNKRPSKPDIGTSLWNAPIQKIGSLYIKSPQPNAILPSGMSYLPNVLSVAQERQLLATIAATPFESANIRRRLQFHGEVYYHTTHDVAALQPSKTHWNPLSNMQWFVDHVLESTSHVYSPVVQPSQVLVNEYIGDRGLSCHLEDPDAFGHYIYTVSLVNPVWMDLKPVLEASAGTNGIDSNGNKPRREPDDLVPMRILLEPRSVLILSGDARYKWMHGITKTKSVQMPNGQASVLRDENYKRLSLTMRYMRDGRKRSPVA